MEANTEVPKIKQAQFIFWMNLAMATFAMSVFIKSIDSGMTWKIVCSGAGFAVFLVLTILLLVRMLKLQKEARA